MSLITVSEETLVVFNKEWCAWCEAGMPDGDGVIKELLLGIGKLKGVVPRFSCSSHPEDDSGSSFYICTVCTPEGFDNILKLYEGTISSFSDQDNMTHSLEIEISQLLLSDELGEALSRVNIPSITLRAYPETHEEQRSLIDAMSTALEALLQAKE